MNFVVDENVSLGLATSLRAQGHIVTAIAEIAQRGMSDNEIWVMAKNSSSILITRDYHFTNPTRFSPKELGGIIFIRQGNLTSQDEITLVLKFLDHHGYELNKGKLVTLSKADVRIR